MFDIEGAELQPCPCSSEWLQPLPELCRTSRGARTHGDSSPTDRAVAPARSHAPSTPRAAGAHAQPHFRGGGAPLLPPHNAARRRPVAKAASGRRMSASLSVRCGGGRVFLLPPRCRTHRRSPSAPQSARRPRLLRDAPQETGSGRGQQEGGAEEEGEDHRGAYPSPSVSPRGAGASPAAERRSRGHVSASSPVSPGPGGRSPAPSPPAPAASPPVPLGRPLTPARPPSLPGCSRSRGCA